MSNKKKLRMTNKTRITEKPGGKFEAPYRPGPRGGILSAHRFGTDGNCDEMRPEDAVLVAELGGSFDGDFRCASCPSITTGMFGEDGIIEAACITHEPGCAWLTAMAGSPGKTGGTVRIRCAGAAGYGLPGEIPDAPVGDYLASYDPEGRGGRGSGTWTPDKSKALLFEDEKAAMEFYQQVSRSCPVRPDGRPNKPLTAFTVVFDPVGAEVS
jgi:hypothetical protein